MAKQMVSAVMTVTPEMARDWLKLNLPNNRAIQMSRVDAYVRSIRNGEWQLTPEGIMFDSDGNLMDGQHRLSAIAQAGKPVKMVVWTNVPLEAMEVVNTGVARSIADILTVTGGLGISGAARIVVARANIIYRLHHPTFGTQKMTVNHYEWVKDRYQESLEWSMRNYPMSGGGATQSYSQTTRRFRSPTVMGAMVIAHKKNKEAVEVFARKVDRGVEITETEPAYALRRYLDVNQIGAGGGMERMIPAHATLKAVYSAIQHQNLSTIRISFLTDENPEFNKILRYFNVAAS